MGPEYDPEADAAYIYPSARPYARGVDLDESRRVDDDVSGRPIGVELLNVSLGVNLTGLPETDRLAMLLTKRGIRVRG